MAWRWLAGRGRVEAQSSEWRLRVALPRGLPPTDAVDSAVYWACSALSAVVWEPHALCVGGVRTPAAAQCRCSGMPSSLSGRRRGSTAAMLDYPTQFAPGVIASRSPDSPPASTLPSMFMEMVSKTPVGCSRESCGWKSLWNQPQATVAASSGTTSRGYEISAPKTYTTTGEHSGQIFAKTLDGTTITIPIEGQSVVGMMTVAAVQREVERRTSVPCDQQRLIYGGRQLDARGGSAFLSDYAISSGATLHLSVRLPGGIFFETIELVQQACTYICQKTRQGWNWAIGSRCCKPKLPCHCAVPSDDEDDEDEESFEDQTSDSGSDLDEDELNELSVMDLRKKALAMDVDVITLEAIIEKGKDKENPEDPCPKIIALLFEKEKGNKRNSKVRRAEREAKRAAEKAARQDSSWIPHRTPSALPPNPSYEQLRQHRSLFNPAARVAPYPADLKAFEDKQRQAQKKTAQQMQTGKAMPAIESTLPGEPLLAVQDIEAPAPEPESNVRAP